MWLIARLLFGTNDPAPDWLKRLWYWRKGTPVSWKLWMVDGYLMLRFFFKDGSHMDLREVPAKWRGVVYRDNEDE